MSIDEPEISSPPPPELAGPDQDKRRWVTPTLTHASASDATGKPFFIAETPFSGPS